MDNVRQKYTIIMDKLYPRGINELKLLMRFTPASVPHRPLASRNTSFFKFNT